MTTTVGIVDSESYTASYQFLLAGSTTAAAGAGAVPPVAPETTDEAMEERIRTLCFPWNSERWLKGRKESNHDVDENNNNSNEYDRDGVPGGFSQELIQTLIEGPLLFDTATATSTPPPAALVTVLSSSSSFSSIFDETVCHKDSPMRTTIGVPRSRNDTLQFLTNVEDWYHKLLYLGLYAQFHTEPAIEEYKGRYACSQNQNQNHKEGLTRYMKKYQIRSFDYECPTSQFVVIPIGSIGFGAYLNTMAMFGILFALQTQRIPIFSTRGYFSWQKKQKDPETGEYWDPWLLSPHSCTPRRDLQCYFLPTSPCTVLVDDLLAAPIYGSTSQEQRYVYKNMNVPRELQKERIIVINSGLQWKPATDGGMKVRERIYESVHTILQEYKQQHIASSASSSSSSSLVWKEISLAHEWIRTKSHDDKNQQFDHIDTDGLKRSVYIYLLRPNPYYKKVLQKQMASSPLSLSSSQQQQQQKTNKNTEIDDDDDNDNINPYETIGIAIRGSDKCLKESMCYPFERYMELATEFAYPKLNVTTTTTRKRERRPKLIMTTEDPNIFQESLVYQKNQSFPFEFIVNTNDNMQGSGFPKAFVNSRKTKTDPTTSAVIGQQQQQHVVDEEDEGEKTIVSSLIAIQYHFHASKVYLNCCSNFHAVIAYLIMAQCGAVRHGHPFAVAGVAGDGAAGAGATTSTATSTSLLTPKKNPPTYYPTVAQCLSKHGIVGDSYEDIPRQFRICCGFGGQTVKGKEVC